MIPIDEIPEAAERPIYYIVTEKDKGFHRVFKGTLKNCVDFLRKYATHVEKKVLCNGLITHYISVPIDLRSVKYTLHEGPTLKRFAWHFRNKSHYCQLDTENFLLIKNYFNSADLTFDLAKEILSDDFRLAVYLASLK